MLTREDSSAGTEDSQKILHYSKRTLIFMLKKLQKHTREYQCARAGQPMGSWQDVPATKMGRGSCAGSTDAYSSWPVTNPAGFAAASPLVPGGPGVFLMFH